METKFFYALSLCFSVLFFVGCVDKEDVPTPTYLRTDQSTLNLSYEGDDVSLSLESNTTWVITGAKSWIEISKKNGEGSAVISVGAEENESLEPRTCTVFITSEDGMHKTPVQITQAATPSSLSLDTHSLEFKEEAGQSKSFTINSNDSWEISGAPQWVDLSRTTGVGIQSISITTLSVNLSDQVRTAELQVTAGNNKEVITISQAPAWVQNCKVKIMDDIFTMCDGMVFNVEMSDNMDYFYAFILPKEEQAKYSLNEIVELAVESEMKFIDSGIYTISDLYEDMEFVVYFIPFKNDQETGDAKQGTPTSLDFKTKSSSFEPRVFISDPTTDGSYWHYSFTKSSYCHKYYTYISDDIDMFLYYSDLEIAYAINEIVVANEPPMLESGSWYTNMTSNGFIALYALGMRENGELSGTLDWNIGFLGASQSNTMTADPRKTNERNGISQEEFAQLKKRVSESLLMKK